MYSVTYFIFTAMDEIVVKDANGTVLNDGDAVILNRTLKVKGSSLNLKKGTKIKGIRLTEDEDEVECRTGKSTIVLRNRIPQERIVI